MPLCFTPRLGLRTRTAARAILALAATLSVTAIMPAARAADANPAASDNWKYRLTNTSTSTLTTPLDFSIIPPGAVTPPIQVDGSGRPVIDPSTGQPLTQNPLIPVSSTGFDVAATFQSYDPKNLTVALGQDAASGTPSTQTLLLIFGSKIGQDADGNPVFTPILDSHGAPVGGLAPGESIDFRLNLANGATTPPTLVPSSSITSLLTVHTISGPSTRPPGGGPGSSGGGDNSIPEPLSVLVWGGMAGFGAVAARRRRTQSRAAA